MIDSNTKLISIFGNPIKHSLSPIMQNKWLCDCKINAVYLAFAFEKNQLKKAVDSVRELGMIGANVTVPYKIEVMKYLDVIDFAAKKIGSVNTIVNKAGKLIGYNTDWSGFINDLKANKINLKNKKVFVLGAGGACKAVLYALNNIGVKKIFLCSRTYKKVKQLSKLYMNIVPVKIEEIKDDFLVNVDSFINTSTCGMKPTDILPFAINKYNKNIVFYDLIYNKQTPFKKFALKNKLKYFSGEGMLIRQGADAFKLWTLKSPKINAVKKLFTGE
ncbi:shikimate dehydrogenase [Candidatus Ruminimicrobium bovinum]|uniref:shikimate dehydrogenase n=1 Tax=Candidatus Ruminimicrobium bovinum TaxID=3242779 RepID=UPI0039B9A982